MTKFFKTFIFMSLFLCGALITISKAAAQKAVFIEKRMGGGNNKADDKVIQQAKIMREKFANQISVLNIDSREAETMIVNPFENKLPKKAESNPEQIDQPEQQGEDAPVEEEDPPPSVLITGLVWNSERPQAIVNGNVVDIGDNLEGWIIVGISRDGIAIESSTNKEYLLKP